MVMYTQTFAVLLPLFTASVLRLLYILQSCIIFFAGTNLYNLVYVVNENLTVTDMTGVKSLLGSFHNFGYRNLADYNFYFHLREQGGIHFNTTIHLITCVMVIPVTPRSFSAFFRFSNFASFAIITTL